MTAPPGCIVCGGELTGRQRRYDTPGCAKQGARAVKLAAVYGITPAQWDAVWSVQGGRCAICHRPPRPGETFHLDHEHSKGSSGRVRGILCPYCNTRLVGRLKDHSRAQALADYLRAPPALDAIGEVIAPGRPPKRRRKKQGR